MKQYILSLWNDPATFAAAVRSAVALFAMLVQTGVIDLGKPGWYASIPALAGSLLIRAGDKNVSLIDQIKALTPEQAAELKAHLR